MNHFFFSITSLGALGVAGMVAITEPAPEPQFGPDQIIAERETTISRQNAHTWLLTKDATGDICLVTKGNSLTPTTYEVEMDATCTDVFANVDAVEVWQQDQFGNVILADASGNKVLEFMISEELALQSIYPNIERLSLSPNG